MSLSFAAFHQFVHGMAPFPWQMRAAQRLAQRQVFAVNIPTGLGKSALIDAAVWAAAQGGWRRIVFVVDRRIVVDAVHQRALRIAAKLHTTTDPEIGAFCQRLGDIQVVRLRGGVFGDDDWVLYPERLSIILSTVDQVGSRLLFRGYGVSPRRWSLHAGFLASDALIAVDEAHLCAPFLQTLAAIRNAGADIAVIPMSATLAAGQMDQTIDLDAADQGHAVIQQRLRAEKKARLIPCGTAGAEFVRAAVDAVQTLLQAEGVTRIALVVNRVASARQCFNKLHAIGVDTALLIGRVRPIDRDAKLKALLPQIESSRHCTADDRPLVVVTTQTIEVGADLDFDALVTECAPLSALRQRFGRLDRLGIRSQSQAIILGRVAKDRNDPVYGTSLAETWDWLQTQASHHQGEIDFGIAALNETLQRCPPPPEPTPNAASLLPTHLALLAQTGPFVPEFDLSSWLHGPTDRAPDITLVWRSDLAVDAPDMWPKAVKLLPPMLREALSLPVGAARRWLTGGKPSDQWGDYERSADKERLGHQPGRPVVRWRGPEHCELIAAEAIRPGDTVVVPTVYGGCDEWGWAPDTQAAVVDVADACLAERIEGGTTRRVSLRLTTGCWAALGAQAEQIRDAVRELIELENKAVDYDEDVEAAIQQARAHLLETLAHSEHPLAKSLDDPHIERHPLGLLVRGRGTEEIRGSIETGQAVTLAAHHADVSRWAQHLSADHPECQRIVAAAQQHDAGKAEPRMQVMLHGNALAAAAGELLAKSALRRREAQQAAWARSGLPRGFRHELASLEYTQNADALIRTLIATHHGYGRPWIKPCTDPDAAGADFASLYRHWPLEWSQQCQTHGAWRLAIMEWLLRAADARASIEEATAQVLR